MPNIKRVLIFSVSVGTGHTRAAEAIKVAMQENYPGSEVQVVDTFNSTSPLLGKFIFGFYLTMIKWMPVLYRQIYNRADEGKKFSKFSKNKFNIIINKFTRAKLLSMMATFKPDVLICTHPFPLGIMSELKAQRRITLPVAAVITDFIIHPYWLYNNIDTYFVAVPEQKNGLVARGIAEGKIQVTGIPIHPHFNQTDAIDDIRKKLGLKENILTVMIMGGGLGMGPVGKIVKYLTVAQMPVQLLVVVGRNEKLRKRMEEIGRQTNLNIRVFGFVENVHELMAVADLFITKPGGLTVAEALAKGLPMILTKPIPGHEEKNADYLIKAGAAVSAGDEKLLANFLYDCLKNPDQIANMSNNAANTGKPDSAYNVATVLARNGDEN